MESENLWPELNFTPIRQPKSIMMDQAIYLNSITRNLLRAEIQTSISESYDGESIVENFIISVPLLKNYKYVLFRVRHDILAYPVTIMFEATEPRKIYNEEEFIIALKNILGSVKTLEILNSLMSQSQSAIDQKGF